MLRYERFDPPNLEPRRPQDVSPDFEELPRLEYNLMSELDAVILRNRSLSQSSPQAPPRPPVVEKLEVGDLISLDTGEELKQDVVFDPLASDFNPKPHRKLERVGTKYENFQPAGGSSSQPQFRQFVATLVEPATQQPAVASQWTTAGQEQRSSADNLLADYGINFSQASMGPSSNGLTHRHPVGGGGVVVEGGGGVGGGAPLVPPRPSNTSFLHSSPPLYSRPPPLPSRPHIDSLADLDPLHKLRQTDSRPVGQSYSQPRPGLQPPSVPPRGKKQWTTFD